MVAFELAVRSSHANEHDANTRTGEAKMIHDENDGNVKGTVLKDGIVFEQTANWLKFACPKTAPQITLKEAKENGQTVAYYVPENLVFFQARHNLKDGSVVTLLRYKPIPQDVREEFQARAEAAHKVGKLQHRILPLSEGKRPKVHKERITFDSLDAVDGKPVETSNEL